MSRKRSTFLLEEAVGLLVRHFGADRVRAALAKASHGADEASGRDDHPQADKRADRSAPNVTVTLEHLRQTDAAKHRLLADFYTHLKERKR